ncbi:EpsG family protein [Thomasclavelia spiroformis]|uniref:EpsG family protein n=1 Tax=Thomasclavelia spiroformis TaxID=29348 RepID=UPI00255BDD92|nr:EpsG family protein [Thomasclavelia spiroformis]
MSIYLLNCLMTGILGVTIEHNNCKRRLNNILLFLIILIMWSAIYAFRGESVGSDTSGYMYFYNQIGKTSLSLGEYLSNGGDILFEILRYMCYKISGGNWVFFSFVTAVITYFPFLYTIKKENSNHITMILLLYIFFMIYYSGFNATRQAIAVSISFFSYICYFSKKKYIKYFFIMSIAYGFHSTSIFIIPFHFLSKLSIKSKLLWVIIGLLLISTVAFSTVWNTIISLFSMIGNETLANRYIENSYGGSGFFRILVIIFPIILGIWKYKIFKNRNISIDNYLILSIFCAVFMVYSTNNWLFARLSSYFSPFLILFIPKLIFIFKKDSQQLAIFMICILYFLYMIILLLHGEANLYPYNFIYN